MGSGPRQRRATVWAWVYAVLFDPADGPEDDTIDDRDDDSTAMETDTALSSNHDE